MKMSISHVMHLCKQYRPVVSLGSLCTGCMLMIQHCYTGGCIKRKTNGTLQFSVIACSIILVPEVVL